MGKIRREKGSRSQAESDGRTGGLAEQILEDKSIRQKDRVKQRNRIENDDQVLY